MSTLISDVELVNQFCTDFVRSNFNRLERITICTQFSTKHLINITFTYIFS